MGSTPLRRAAEAAIDGANIPLPHELVVHA